jgi:hypothetical protein
VRPAETRQVYKSREQLQLIATAIYISGLGSNFLLVMVGLSYQSWLYLCISHGWLLGFLLESFVVKVKVLGGGFGLWLGDNIVILSMVK